MSVSYHLIPVDKKTESFIDISSFKLNNDFSIFAELMINFPDKFLGYFDKHELFFDFIYSLNESEKSKITYQPENIKSLFLELLEILKTKEGFPIKFFNCFKYEDIMESSHLYVNLKGSELNKIAEDKVYYNDSNFDINTSFDKWNNYSLVGEKFEQRDTVINIKTEEGERFKSNLDLNSFPNEISINGTLSNINLGKDIKQISMILKTPYEHLYPMFKNLIEICNTCIDENYGLKSFVSY